MAGDLPGNVETVLFEKLDRLAHEAVRRFETGQAKKLAVKLETVPDDIQRPLGIALFDERLDQLDGELVAVQLLHLLPEVFLGVLDEVEGVLGEERPALVPQSNGTDDPAFGRHGLLYVRFEGFFGAGVHGTPPNGIPI